MAQVRSWTLRGSDVPCGHQRPPETLSGRAAWLPGCSVTVKNFKMCVVGFVIKGFQLQVFIATLWC